ncbi:hypothetical protein CWE12_06990 [Aliidiomarina sedimenti]|uniref:PIN domain-containing protein n=1 Tax=Aliidiomarina sedimenti TaxID=1933879 RepID=A0ABY0BYE3_9GAMM|nr:hypothetical protein [Aliidiomarina sedimenti]RUO29710.1 hypothetical protein CWE12_06990 [Aliidiomarina sedimenti]
MALDPFYANIFIDSCAFDPKYEPETSASDEIFERYEKGEINLVVAHSTLKESEHPNTPTHVKAAAAKKLYTIETGLAQHERQKKQEIWDILTGNGKPEKMQQDAEHVFEAHKYGGYFITTDNRILKLRGELHKICNAHIVKPGELLALIEEHENS